MIGKYKQWLEGQYSHQTVDTYIRAIQKFEKYIGAGAISQATYSEIWQYLSELRKKGWASGYIHTTLASTKAYYRFLVQYGERLDNPARNIQINDGKAARGQIQFQELFTQGEMDMLLEKDSRYSLLIARNKLVVSLYIYQGLTTGEIARLTVDNLNPDEQTIYIKASRKLNSRILPLNPKQMQLAERYIGWDRERLLKFDSDALFISKLGNVEKGEGFHYLIESQRALFAERLLNPVTIRQSVIVNWFRQGLGIKEVQTRAGHKWPSTTECYKPTDLTELKAAMDRFHPLG